MQAESMQKWWRMFDSRQRLQVHVSAGIRWGRLRIECGRLCRKSVPEWRHLR